MVKDELPESFQNHMADEEGARRLDAPKQVNFQEVGESGLLNLYMSLRFFLCHEWMSYEIL